MDDLHVVAGMPVTQREVARHLREHARAGGRILAAAGVLTELPDLVGMLRIAGARFVDVRPPALTEMTRLLVALAGRSGIPLAPEAARSIAVRCGGDVRLAEGALARLRLVESLEGRAHPLG